MGSTLLAGAFLVGAAWLNGLRRRLGRALAADTNLGTRRVLALTLAGAACITVPLALLNAAFSSNSSSSDAAAHGVVSAAGDAASAAAAAAAASSSSSSSPSLLWFLLVACLFGCVHLLLGDIALELPLLSSVFGGSGSSGALAGLAGAGSAGSGSSTAGSSAAPSSGGAQATAMAAQDTAAVRCVLLLLVLAGGSMACVLGSPALSSQLTLLGLLGACVFYAPAVVAASGLDTRRAVLTLRKRMASEGSGGGALLPTSATDLATSGSGAAGFVTSWFQGLGDLFLVAGHAAGLVSAGGSDVSRREDRGGVAANRWDDERNRGGGGGGFQALTRRVLRHVWADPNSRKILIFLAINFTFMFVEISVGWLTNSLGLISDAGHMFFDNASLFIGLYASYMARWAADGQYTYGYARYEVLAGFVNAIFLVFVGLSVVFEAVERLWEPPEIHGEHLLTVSVLGMCVNLVGLVFFHDFAHGHSHGSDGGGCSGHGHAAASHGHSHGGSSSGGSSAGSCSDHGHSHGGSDHGHSHGGAAAPAPAPAPSAAAVAHHNENMHGVFLHVLADTLGSLGVIISSLLIKLYGWNLADPIASIFISALILLSVVPLIKGTAWTLLSRVPPELEDNMRGAVASLQRLPDVVAVEQPHFWKQHGENLVGTVHLLLAASAPAGAEQRALRMAQGVLRGAGVATPTVQVERERDAGAPQLPAGSDGDAVLPAGVAASMQR